MSCGPWWQAFKRLTGITDEMPNRTQEAAAFNHAMKKLREDQQRYATKTTTNPQQEKHP